MKATLVRSFFVGLVSLILFTGASPLLFSATRSSASRSVKSRKLVKTKKTKILAAHKRKVIRRSKKPVRRRTLARRRRVYRLRPVDPTIGDNIEGEDLVVRRQAVEALGHLNGSMVVVDPSNGRILSIVNQKLALGIGYQPCSTFKLAISLAGLSEGVFSKDSEFRCPYRGYLNFTDALAYSCNQYFQNVGQRLGFDRVRKYAQEFGFGELAGWHIKGEIPGVFPKEIGPQWIRLLSSHGYFIEVTPLEMAAFASAIANGGTLYYLQYPRTPEEIANFEPRIKRRLDIARLLPDLKEGMSGSVTYGSGRHAYDPLEPIYGKTGSCSNQEGIHLGWFVSYAGDEGRKLVVVVLIRGSVYTEGPYAAMIAGKFYRGLSQQNFFSQYADEKAMSATVAAEPAPANAPNNR